MPICKKCKKEFPNRVKIDNKYHNLQKRKYCIKCSPFGLHNTKQIDKETKFTKICYRCKIKKNKSEFHKKGRSKQGSYCKICASEVDKISRSIKKQKIIEYAGSQCTICNYDKCYDALEFHHLDPSKKDFQISRMGNRSLSKIYKEIDKCILICSNCHKEIHASSYEKCS